MSVICKKNTPKSSKFANPHGYYPNATKTSGKSVKSSFPEVIFFLYFPLNYAIGAMVDLSRNAVSRKAPWVRIPPLPPLGTNANPTRVFLVGEAFAFVFPLK
jgi:hypothetical protein